MSEDSARVIELTERQRERLDKLKVECTEGGRGGRGGGGGGVEA